MCIAHIEGPCTANYIPTLLVLEEYTGIIPQTWYQLWFPSSPPSSSTSRRRHCLPWTADRHLLPSPLSYAVGALTVGSGAAASPPGLVVLQEQPRDPPPPPPPSSTPRHHLQPPRHPWSCRRRCPGPCYRRRRPPRGAVQRGVPVPELEDLAALAAVPDLSPRDSRDDCCPGPCRGGLRPPRTPALLGRRCCSCPGRRQGSSRCCPSWPPVVPTSMA
jgi:hypothetical protein